MTKCALALITQPLFYHHPLTPKTPFPRPVNYRHDRTKLEEEKARAEWAAPTFRTAEFYRCTGAA